MRKNLVAKATFLLLALLFTGIVARAQQTDVPRIISYQGKIDGASGQPISDGKHAITISLYRDEVGEHKVWTSTEHVDIKGGVFNLQLGASKALPKGQSMSGPLYVGVSVNGTTEMRPLAMMTAAPYSLNVPDRSITREKLSDDLQTLITSPIGGQEKQNDPDDWTIGGDAITSSQTTDLGTTSGSHSTKKNWRFITNSIHTMRFEDNSTNTPNIIGGYSGNTITTGLEGCVVAGGGKSTEINSILSEFGVIGGGKLNTIDELSEFSNIGGGFENIIFANNSTVSGGEKNHINASSDSTEKTGHNVISGGFTNKIVGAYNGIGSGNTNNIWRLNVEDIKSVYYSFIGGGQGNIIRANESVIGGGYNNSIQCTGSTSTASSILGGTNNLINDAANNSGILGGESNTISAGNQYSFIGGGLSNLTSSEYSSIPSGDHLIAQSYAQTVIGKFNEAKGSSFKDLIDPSLGINAKDPIFIIGNGLEEEVRSNAFEVAYEGHSIVFDINYNGRFPPGFPTPFYNNAAIMGATYTDNIIYAWADVNAIGVAAADFGVYEVRHNPLNPGKYLVVLNQTLTDFTQRTFGNCSITATLSTGAPGSVLAYEASNEQDFDGVCRHITASRPFTMSAGGQTRTAFIIYITEYDPKSSYCVPVDNAFFLKVTGR